MRRRNPTRRDLEKAAKACYVAGVLMLVSGTVGSTSLVRLGYALLKEWLPFFDALLTVVLVVALIIAGLGGLAVLAAGGLLHRGRRTAGTLLVNLAVGSGIVGLAFHLLLTTVEGKDPVAELLALGSTLAGLAVLLTIYARLKVSTISLR